MNEEFSLQPPAELAVAKRLLPMSNPAAEAVLLYSIYKEQKKTRGKYIITAARFFLSDLFWSYICCSTAILVHKSKKILTLRGSYVKISLK